MIMSFDPGLTGAWIKFHDDFQLHTWGVLPIKLKNDKKIIDCVALNHLLILGDIYAVERQQAMPDFMMKYNPRTGVKERVDSKMGNTGIFTSGTNWGRILACMELTGKKIIEVAAVSWKRHFNLIGKNKAASKELATRLSGNDFILPRGRVPNEGVCEAYLIGRYYIEKFIEKKEPAKEAVQL